MNGPNLWTQSPGKQGLRETIERQMKTAPEPPEVPSRKRRVETEGLADLSFRSDRL